MSRDTQILYFDRFNVERSVYAPGLYMAPHRDKLSRISIILNGELWEATEDGSVHAREHYVVIKPNHVVHEDKFGTKPLHLLSVTFNDDHLLSRHFNDWEWFNHPGIQVAGMRLWAGVQRSKQEAALTEHLDIFFAHLRQMQPGGMEGITWPEALKELLQSNLDEPQGLQQLSAELALHRVSMARGFKKRYGLSPVQFRQYTRAMKALQELAVSNRSISVIAYETGFSDQAHLTRTLKSLAGCTPQAFRKLHQ